ELEGHVTGTCTGLGGSSRCAAEHGDCCQCDESLLHDVEFLERMKGKDGKDQAATPCFFQKSAYIAFTSAMLCGALGFSVSVTWLMLFASLVDRVLLSMAFAPAAALNTIAAALQSRASMSRRLVPATVLMSC